jgi:hypothetical protein
MSDAVQSVLVGTLGLQVALIAACLFAVKPVEPRSVAVSARIAVLLQALHFAEEWRAGFPERFPEMLGLAPWPAWFFAPFNIACFALWLAAILDRSKAYFSRVALWFLVIAALFNAVAHPLLALRAGGYFPGLYTAPLVGLAGLWLAIGLRRKAVPD